MSNTWIIFDPSESSEIDIHQGSTWSKQEEISEQKKFKETKIKKELQVVNFK